MTTVASIRNSEYVATCAKCSKALITPKWSEYVSDGLVLNFWYCLNCGYQFETEAYMPADAESVNDDIVIRVHSPSLVA